MKTFYISITETLNRVIAIDAEDLDEAIEKAENACNDGTVDLNAEDFVQRDFEDETKNAEESIALGIIAPSHYKKI